MKKTIILVAALAACSKSREEKKKEEPAPRGNSEISLAQATEGLPGEGKLKAEIETGMGSIHCELLPDAAPKTVASFVGLARGKRAWLDPKTHDWVKQPFFDGLAFHRVIPEFMIQGGDPLSRDPADQRVGTGGPGFTLPDEIAADRKFDHGGVLAMANTGPRTHSGGSQFFITEVPFPSLDGGYVVFGECHDIDVVKAIARVPKDGERPSEAVTMKVRIYRE